MKIDLNNYEVWMIDFLDGNLDAHQSKEMEAFLLKHPHIAEDIEDLESIVLQKETRDHLPQTFLSSLKKEDVIAYSGIEEDNYQEYFIAYHEGDLEKKRKTDVLDFLSLNPVLRAEFQILEKTKVKANLHIAYPNKSELRKREKKLIPLWMWSSMAAAILVIGFWIVNLPNMEHPNYSPSKINSKAISKIEIHHPSEVFINRDTYNSFTSSLKEEEIGIERTETPVLLASNTIISIPIQNQDWQKQMDLMQGYAFEKNQLYSLVDWSELPSENSKNGVRLISSLLWKTTKAQVQNFSEEVMNNDFPVLSSNNLENLTGGVISIKRPAKEVE